MTSLSELPPTRPSHIIPFLSQSHLQSSCSYSFAIEIPKLPSKKKKNNKWYTILNPNNKYIKEKEIESILEKGGVHSGAHTKINNLSLWQKAFVHKSYITKICEGKNARNDKESDSDSDSEKEINNTNEKLFQMPLQEESNERLEWLGDGQLQSAVSQYLFERYPEQDEGFLTKLRSKLVKTKNLSFLANKLGFSPYLVISHHVEFGCGGRTNQRILENTFEAFLGAMYLDFSQIPNQKPDYSIGYKMVRKFFITLIENYVDLVEMVIKDDNFKDSLMWFYQKNFNGAYPIYKQEKIENDLFHIYVENPITQKIAGKGSARSKKQAEQIAAKNALQYYSISKSHITL
jgi:ribonuclease III